MNKTKIEWCNFTGNPVDGLCLYKCFYCYEAARRKRFKLKDKITFRGDWFNEKQADNFTKKYNKPAKIFVGSTHDLFGNWIPKEWIELIIDVAKANPQHTFQFLTKNPKRYLEFDFPKNCWLGTTMTRDEDGHRIVHLLKKENYKFVSFEPLLGKFDEELDIWVKGIDLVIVGAMTGKNAVVPKQEWIKSIKHSNIFWKDNIKKYLK